MRSTRDKATPISSTALGLRRTNCLARALAGATIIPSYQYLHIRVRVGLRRSDSEAVLRIMERSLSNFAPWSNLHMKTQATGLSELQKKLSLDQIYLKNESQNLKSIQEYDKLKILSWNIEQGA